MDLNSFEQTKDIRQRVGLAIRASEEKSDDLLFHCCINQRFLSDIFQISIQDGEDDSEEKDTVYESLKEYYMHWSQNKDIQTTLLASAGIKGVESKAFLRNSRKGYQSFLQQGITPIINASQVENVICTQKESTCDSEEKKAEGKVENTADDYTQIIKRYREGRLGLRTLILSFQGWLLYKIRIQKE